MVTDKKEKTNLKVVGEGIVEHDGDEPYADLRQSILELKETIDQCRWTMAENLFEVHHNSIFHRWGYNNFEQYVMTELKMTERTAQYLTSMYSWFMLELGPMLNDDEEREKMIAGVRRLGWTKATCLIGITNKDNVHEWIEKAQELTTPDLKSEARKALVEMNGGNSKDVKETKHLNLAFIDDQYIPVAQALSMAEKIADSNKKSHLISLICQDFVATTMSQTDAGQKNRGKYFNKIAAQFGVKLIAVDIQTGEVVHNKAVLKQIKD